MTDRSKDLITNAQIDTILDVNRKAVEIHSEVGQQNEAIIEDLNEKQEVLSDIVQKIDRISETVKETNIAIKTSIEKKVEEIEKNLFRLIVILSTIGVGTIIAIVQSYLHR